MYFYLDPKLGSHGEPRLDGAHLGIVMRVYVLSSIDVMRVYVPRFFVSSQQRFGATDIKALSASPLSGLGQTVL